METVTDYIFWAPKPLQMVVTTAMKLRHLLLGRKAMTKLDSILKSRDVTLPTTVRLVKAMIFPVVVHGCESWTMKKAECRRIDAFELWCWRRLFFCNSFFPPSTTFYFLSCSTCLQSWLQHVFFFLAAACGI